MLPNTPYIHLREDETSGMYFLDIFMFLKDHKISKNVIRNPNTTLDAHENRRRLSTGHPYMRNMNRAVVQIDLDHIHGHVELWSHTHEFPYNILKRGHKGQSEMIQVIVKGEEDQNHDGSSTAHLGDPD